MVLIIDLIVLWRPSWRIGGSHRDWLLRWLVFVPGRRDLVDRLMRLLWLGDKVWLGGDMPLAGSGLLIVPGA